MLKFIHFIYFQYVAAFAVSSISSNWDRIGKPFNPLLGETYELNRYDICMTQYFMLKPGTKQSKC